MIPEKPTQSPLGVTVFNTFTVFELQSKSAGHCRVVVIKKSKIHMTKYFYASTELQWHQRSSLQALLSRPVCCWYPHFSLFTPVCADLTKPGQNKFFMSYFSNLLSYGRYGQRSRLGVWNHSVNFKGERRESYETKRLHVSWSSYSTSACASFTYLKLTRLHQACVNELHLSCTVVCLFWLFLLLCNKTDLLLPWSYLYMYHWCVKQDLK